MVSDSCDGSIPSATRNASPEQVPIARCEASITTPPTTLLPDQRSSLSHDTTHSRSAADSPQLSRSHAELTPLQADTVTINSLKRPNDEAAAQAAKRRHTRATLHSKKIPFPGKALAQSASQQLDLRAISDMNTVPDDIKSCPIVLRLASLQEAIGQFAVDDIKRLRLPGHLSMHIHYGRDNLDAGLSIKFSYTKDFKITHPAWMTKKEQDDRRKAVRAGRCEAFDIENHTFKCRTGVKAANGQWQLSDIQADVLTSDTLKRPAYVCAYLQEPVEKCHDFRSDEWVIMKFTMRSPQIASRRVRRRDWDEYMGDMAASNIDATHIVLLRAMLSSADIKLVAYFKPPLPARRWIHTDFQRFKDEVQIHLPPLSPYCYPHEKNENDWRAISIDLDFIKPQSLSEGVLFPVRLDCRSSMLEDIKDGRIDLSKMNLSQLPFKEVFPDLRTAKISLKLAIVREHQCEISSLTPITCKDAIVSVVHAFQLETGDQWVLDLTVHVPADGSHKVFQLSKLGTTIKINARDERFKGHELIGKVRQASEEEKALLLNHYGRQTHIFLISVIVVDPHLVRTLIRAPALHPPGPNNTFPASITPIIDEASAKRSLGAIDAWRTETDMVATSSPLTRNYQDTESTITFDIAAGPQSVAYHEGDIAKGLTGEGCQNLKRYGVFLAILRDHASPTLQNSQHKFLQHFTTVSDKHIVINSCAGSLEVENLAWLILGLLMVGHKILLAARTDSMVDVLAVEIQERIVMFTGIVSKLLSDNEQQTGQYETYVELYETVNKLKCLRWLLPDEQVKLLKATDHISGDLVQVRKTGRSELFGNDASNQVLDAIARSSASGDTAALASDHTAFNIHSAIYRSLVQSYDNRKKSFERFHPIRRRLDFPVAFSMRDRLQRVSQDSDSTVTTTSEAGRRVSVGHQENVSTTLSTNIPEVMDEYYTPRVGAAQSDIKRLFGLVVSESDLIIGTCNTVQHVVLTEHFKATGCVLVQAESISQANAICIWQFPHEWAISVGDENQCLLHQTDSQSSECTDLMVYSDLKAWIERGSPAWSNYEQVQGIPDLYRWVKDYIYKGIMTDGPLTNGMRDHECAVQFRFVMRDRHTTIVQPGGSPVHGSPIFTGNYYLKDVDGQVLRCEPDYINSAEAGVIVGDAAALVARGVGQDKITILCYYEAQVVHIQKLLSSQHLVNISVFTVDSFARKSNNIMLVSLTGTVTYKSVNPALAPFVYRKNRLVVASTCAKYGCAVYGNFTGIMNVRAEGQTGYHPIKNMILNAERRLCMLNGTKVTKSTDHFRRNDFRSKKLGEIHRYIEKHRPGQGREPVAHAGQLL